MKVLLINGSPNHNGATAKALNEMENIFKEEGIEVSNVLVGASAVRGCIDCGKCRELCKCVFNDIVNEVAEKFEEADGLVIASPVYYASANATLIGLLDRLFHSTRFSKTMKVGAAVATARRGGVTATFDQLNKYFTISGMPIASGQYWNGFHGTYSGDEQDQEGLQQMRTLARNMVFLMRSIELGKKEYGLPKREKGIYTNFIR
jgi:multimeric flavodoxin WrbA